METPAGLLPEGYYAAELRQAAAGVCAFLACNAYVCEEDAKLHCMLPVSLPILAQETKLPRGFRRATERTVTQLDAL